MADNWTILSSKESLNSRSGYLIGMTIRYARTRVKSRSESGLNVCTRTTEEMIIAATGVWAPIV